jgi:hypothetical protein
VPAVRLDGGEAPIVAAQNTLDDLGTVAQQKGPSAPRSPGGLAASCVQWVAAVEDDWLEDPVLGARGAEPRGQRHPGSPPVAP